MLSRLACFSSLFIPNRNMASSKLINNLIWVDCEMTGLDVEKDQLLEIAVVITDSGLNNVDMLDPIHINASRETLDSMGDWCKTHFAKNGLTEQCLNSKITIEEADTLLNDFMMKNKIKNGILAGNSIAYDRKFLNKYCPKFVSNLHYRMVDVSAVKVLVNMWYKDTSFYNKPTEHRALSDIQQSIDELKYYRSKYFKE